MEKLNQEEIEIIESKYRSNWRFQNNIIIFGLIIGTIILFIPLDILGKARRSGISGSLIDNNGYLKSFIYMILFVGFIWALMYLVNIANLKKDLKYKIKIVGNVKVKKIEYLSKKIAADLEGNKDTILHFEKNGFKIKDFYFNKGENPEYLKASQMIIERAKYSKIEFKAEII